MPINLIQIMAIIFAAFAWSRAILRFKDRKITFKEMILWSVIWIAVFVIALIPGLTFNVANTLGIKRGIDVAVYSSIILLLYLIFRLYVKIETLQHETTRLVREIAINKAKK